MKVIAFAGSNSSQSINKQLVELASKLIDLNVEVLDLNNYDIPTYSIDIEKNGFPEGVTDFYETLKNADIILISLAEHNAGYTAVFKSYIDWCTRINYKFLTDKKLFVMSTSPGGYAGKNAREAGVFLLEKLGGEIIELYSLPKFSENFNDGDITNPVLKNELVQKINSFKSKIFYKN